MIAAAQTAREESTRTQAGRGRFYKPELDALRFLAFLMALVHHGPVTGSLTGVLRAGGFGISIFFLLSAYLERYGRSYDLYSRSRPGMTGLWQVSGRNRTTYTQRVAIDEFYVNNWSAWLDLYILS